jgi:hypothetical protein
VPLVAVLVASPEDIRMKEGYAIVSSRLDPPRHK